jgi:hypothetical protein
VVGKAPIALLFLADPVDFMPFRNPSERIVRETVALAY